MTTIRSDRRIPINVLMVSCGMNLVRHGGDSLHELREDFYDAARSINFRGTRGLLNDIDSIYAVAMMGGVPYDQWS